MDSSEFVSPPRRRPRGGTRPGAGRKKKATPVKVAAKIDQQSKRRRRLRSKWQKLQKKLIVFTRTGDFGDEYDEVRGEYVRLSKTLGLVHSQGSTSGEQEHFLSVSSESEVTFYIYCFPNVLICNFHGMN